ncbi:MAG: outer membrane beta-barrel family protein [Bacteroidales bacterium]|nr:outer membrane beta-barrel family protein [Bacteroidales bacterium]
MKKEVAIIFILASLSVCPAFAQWEGSLKANGGWNFLQSNTEDADFKLKYSGKKFYIGTGVYIGHGYQPSSQITSILDAKKEQSEYYKGENKTIKPRNYKAGANIDFGYIFNPANVLSASVGYGFSGKDEYSNLETERYNGLSRDAIKGTQLDSTFVKSHNINGKINYSHKFESRPDARLDITLSEVIGVNADAKRRITSGEFYSNPKNYATYSNLNDFNTKLSASYDDVFRFEKSQLKLRAGLDYISNQDLDGYSARTLVNGQWRDSTSYRQSYFYNSHSTEPYVNLTYSIGKFDFFVKERAQIYWHAMLDKLEEKKKPEDLVGLFDKYDFQNLLAAGINYNINDRHRLALDYGRTISRPDYKKLCPTLMIGDSEGEYFIGNSELLPEITDKVNLGYTYTKGIFVTNFDINYRNKRNTAEKVIDLEKSKDVTDPGVKTIYTWINNKRQDSFGAKLDLKMNGRDVKAEIWAGFNYDIYGNKEKNTKEDFNYELGTSIDVFLNETTKLSSSLVYISAKQSAYNLKGEDVMANIRFSKALVKGLELYAELKDIVDKDIYEETWNADMNYLKVSSKTPMHRAVLIGINYAF